MIPPAFPTAEELAPQLERLERTPGSVLLIALELPTTQNFCRVGVGFFDAAERKALHVALTACRKRREKNNTSVAVRGS
jgi:hypothetical protein